MTIARAFIEDASALVALILFISTAAVWSAIFCGA
jgi:hypothetical protein